MTRAPGVAPHILHRGPAGARPSVLCRAGYTTRAEINVVHRHAVPARGGPTTRPGTARADDPSRLVQVRPLVTGPGTGAPLAEVRRVLDRKSAAHGLCGTCGIPVDGLGCTACPPWRIAGWSACPPSRLGKWWLR